MKEAKITILAQLLGEERAKRRELELELEASQSLLKEQHSNAMHRRMAIMDRIRQVFIGQNGMRHHRTRTVVARL